MGIHLTVKSSDTRDWSFTLSDASNDELDLTSARVKFRLRRSEQSSANYFARDTDGTGSDYITIGTPASDGGVTITPTMSDYIALSDMYGVYVGEFWIQDSDDDIIIHPDFEINIQEPLY